MKSVLRKISGLVKIFALALAITFLVLALGSGTTEAKKNTEKKTTTGKVQLTPEKLALLDHKRPTIVYDSMGRQDPFRPFFDLTHIERSIPSDPSRPRTPLEKFALNQYHLVGIMLAGGEHNYALVEDPERVGYTVHVGDLIGNQNGRVKEINENEVIVEEPYLDIFDKRQTRTITLRLHALDEQPLTPLLPDNQEGLTTEAQAPEQKTSATAPTGSGQPEINSIN